MRVDDTFDLAAVVRWSWSVAHQRAVRRHLLALLCSMVVVTASCDSLAGASGVVPPMNPTSDLWARPAYSFGPGHHSYEVGQALPACWAWGSGRFIAKGRTTRCVEVAVAATNRAHHVEGLSSLTLPKNFSRLSAEEQLLVLTDIERVSRGEPPVLGLSATANGFAQSAAKANMDPSLPSASDLVDATGAWAANYAGGVNTLDANYAWMYEDGWGGSSTLNYDCTSPTASGCWGHRDNILLNASTMACYQASCSLVMGAGYVPQGAGSGYSSYTELFVQVAGGIPPLYYTWARALANGAKA
jgi:hypothetical protein